LITGTSGMFGATLVNELKNELNIFATGASFFEGQPTDYMKFDLKSSSYQELIDWARPEIIIHCGALTNAEYCEANPNEAFIINGFSVFKFLQATKKSVKIIYISTDAVFPSSLHLAKETDCVSPENTYGKSKELGEFFLNRTINRDYTIIRTTIVGLNINKEKRGFVEWIISRANQDRDLRLFNDVLFSPISIWDLANEIKFLIKSNNINSETLHITSETCDKYQFGKLLLENLNISTAKLFEGSILSFKERANRSMDQSMDSSFYIKKYNRNLPSLNQTIINIKKHYTQKLP